MAAVFDMRRWLVRVRKSKLSTRVTILFAGALVFPWFAYAWLTLTDRAEQIATTERHLVALAAAYRQHATTIMRFAAHMPAGEMLPTPGYPLWTATVEEQVAAFRTALDAPDVKFSLHRVGTGSNGSNAATPVFDDTNRIIITGTDASSDIVADASMPKAEVLKEWRARAYTQGIALLIRSLAVVGVGWFLVRQ
jgi:hypothetical protein